MLDFSQPVLEKLKRRMFWMVARTCFTLYRTFPLFGTLRASVGIIQRGDKFLMIHRNDGRGISLPGGISSWREPEEQTLQREILEETGLTVSRQELKVRYYSKAEVPCNISVYKVQTTGEPNNSWEGSAKWTSLAELGQRLMASQRPLLPLLKDLASGAETIQEKHREN